MDADSLIALLGYEESRAFLGPDRWHEALQLAHVFRRTAESCESTRIRGRFRGVYTLGLRRATQVPTTPIVYVCEAPDAQAAAQIHRLTWNQSESPFLIVHTPEGVRLYTGFDYEPGTDATASHRGVLEACVAFEDVADKLDAFRARHIDDGTVWERWQDRIKPDRRVDVRLLKNLRDARDWLVDDELEPTVAHALIGRFVYLRYLRDRALLTDARIRRWDLDPSELFSRDVRRRSFHALLERVDEWLNGSIFPLARSGPRAATARQIQRVAGVMLGDEVESGQYHLNFRAYDFSHIPIELLSSIYEQFMALEGQSAEAGAYYTPLPLVNFVLRELDDLLPLEPGMRVFDPSCGSGAFLVRAYQLLAEKVRQEAGRDLSSSELRALLTDHIFGLERDGDACRVAEFSLALALLDQIPNEALGRAHRFRLPALHDRNIFEGDFFDPKGSWQEKARGFDWIVGNPPWIKAKSGTPSHESALRWMKLHARTEPVCGNQIAQAFAWKATEHLVAPGAGAAALVMPAMTLFEGQTSFRSKFFERMDVKAVANLTNLREVLFRNRARLPAAVLFYQSRSDPAEQTIAVYSPMVLNQQANRPGPSGARRTVWTITVNHSEVRTLYREQVESGDPLPWKTSMWGHHRDLRLLRATARRFPRLEDFAQDLGWKNRQGLRLRDVDQEYGKREKLETIPELIGKAELDVLPLRNCKHVHSFPKSCLTSVPRSRGYLRKRSGSAGLEVSRPPHIIVSAACSFAVFTDEFVVVPHPNMGIAGQSKDEPLLRALALYLSSSFARYHQFFHSPQQGIHGARCTLDALRELPIPFSESTDLGPWLAAHRKLVELSDRRWALVEAEDALVSESEVEAFDAEMAYLEGEVDQLVATALGLTDEDLWLVEDLVHVRFDLVDGRVGERAAGSPTEEEMSRYAVALRDTLDAYLDRGEQFRHEVAIVHEPRAGMVRIRFEASLRPHQPVVESADGHLGTQIATMRDRIEERQGQWIYFDRNLTVYLHDMVFLCKPMERVWWTRSQALADADQIIADLVEAGGAA